MTPEQRVYEKAQLFCCWCGIAFFILFFVGLMPLMQFIPPPSPTLPAAELIANYADNLIAVRAGIIVCIIASTLLIPWSVMIAFQVYRMERGRIPLMSVLSLGAGLVNAVFFILPFVFWSAAFYRVERNPELIILINDMTWLEFVMIAPPFIVQTLAIAYAGFTSTAKQIVLPRWFCFFSVWVGLLILPGMVALFFYSGPFAWNGLLAFWMPVAIFSVYIPCAFVLFYRAIKTHKFDLETA